VKYSNRKTRIVSFEFSVEQAYAIEFGHLYCRFHLDGGTMLTGSIPYEVATPYTEEQLEDLKFTQSADILYIVHPDHQPRMLSRYSDSPPDWRLDLFSFEGGPFMTSNIEPTKTLAVSGGSLIKGSTVTLSSNFDLFQSEHVGSLFRLRHQISGQAMSQALSFNAVSGGNIKCGGTWRVITHGNWGGKLSLEKSIDNGLTWTLLRHFSSNWNAGTSEGDFNVNTFGTDEGVFLLRVRMEGHQGGTCNVDLSSDPFESTGVVKITARANLRSCTAKVMSEVGSTAAIFDWAEGSWSEARGYPSAIVFFEDRLCFGATSAEPQTIWMSKTGAYNDFGRSQPLEDTDGVTVNLPSRKMNGINNLVGLSEILALTSATEWQIGPSDQGAVTPTSIQSKLQGYRGCSTVDPVHVGNRVVYVQPMGAIIRDLGYDYQSSGYAGNDLSIFANHLFSGHTITEMAYQQEPDSLIWCVRSDGKLLALTYVKEHDIAAWSWHDTQGQFESICTIPAQGYDELWMVVKRGSSRFVERMAHRVASTNAKHQFFVDCGISYDQPKSITGISKAASAVVTAAGHGFLPGDLVDLSDIEAEAGGMSALNGLRFLVGAVTTNTFQLLGSDSSLPVDTTGYLAYSSGGVARKVVTVVAGLEHLNGKTVSILADGNVHPAQVVSSGQVTLNPGASIVHVGLAFESDFQTLNIELRLGDGTTQDRRVKIPEVTFRFLNSRGGWIGPDSDNLTEINQRTNEALGAPIELITGDYVETLNSGYERSSSVFFRQRDPLPVTILAVMPKVTLGG
jgi:hypothetical protein